MQQDGCNPCQQHPAIPSGGERCSGHEQRHPIDDWGAYAIVMLVFTALVVCRWVGWASPDLSEALELKLLGIVQLGIGGYIASRGVKEVAKHFRG